MNTDTLQAKLDAALTLIESIARADIKNFSDAEDPENEFRQWAQNRARHMVELLDMEQVPQGTPSSRWKAKGEPDPLDAIFDCQRASLALGEFTDDELANAVFMYGDTQPNMEDVIAGKVHMPIVYLTAAKERIRWLSRALDTALALNQRPPQATEEAEKSKDNQ